MTPILIRHSICRAVAAISLTLVAACAPGREPVPPGVIPEPQPLTHSEEQYGHQVLSALTEQYPLDYNHPRSPEVMRIVDRLTAASNADKDPWHVYILQDKEMKNAAATRGNHVFVWTPMLESAKTEDELASVLAHEISHVLARHTEPDPNEQIRKLLIGVGSMAAGIAVSRSGGYMGNMGRVASSVTQQVGSGLLVNPYSREREKEADQIGLFMMAAAGYNPQAAIDFWTRAQNDPGFSSTFAFFSTHPPAAERLETLRALLPAAEARFKGKPAAKTGRGPDSFNVGQNVPPSRAEPRHFALKHKSERWQVTARRAVLYAEPSERSRAVGEFGRGAKVVVVGRKGDWLEVSGPDRGFISLYTARPENAR